MMAVRPSTALFTSLESLPSTNMATKTKANQAVRIEITNQDQAALVSYGLGLVHQELSSRLSEVSDEKLDSFMGNVKFLRKHANTLNEKFDLPVNNE